MSGPSDTDRCGWPEALLFDLDGTLIDSVPDLTTSANLLLGEDGLQPLAIGEVRSMIGNGVRKLVERAFAARDVLLDEAGLDVRTGRMMVIYADYLTAETVFMPSAREIVTTYHKANTRIAVVTNKPEGFSRTILDKLGICGMVDCVVGGDSGPARKPAPDMLLHACRQMNVQVSRAVMVGDSPADIDAARNASMACVAVRGGYTSVPVEELGADVLIDTLADLPGAIEKLKEPA
jgi:phosphoglycolate phosphatase